LTTTAYRPAGDVGGTLRGARERKGVSLRQIADVTRISVGMLDALERNDISRLPGGIFSRAFVRSFASEVGLDPETTVLQFIAQYGGDSVTAGHPPSRPIEDTDALESNRRVASTFIGLLALSVPIAGVIIYWTVSGQRSSSLTPDRLPTPPPLAAAAAPDRASSISLPAISEVAAARAAAPAAPGQSAAREPAAASLVVGLIVSRQSRVSATVDGQKQIEWVLKSGDRRAIEVRRDLALTIGDAGAVAMTINGMAARPLGKSGEVVTTHLDLTNFRMFLAPQ
jgi:cytoskeleton protein RodZ